MMAVGSSAIAPEENVSLFRGPAEYRLRVCLGCWRVAGYGASRDRGTMFASGGNRPVVVVGHGDSGVTSFVTTRLLNTNATSSSSTAYACSVVFLFFMDQYFTDPLPETLDTQHA
ncbi:unnamed protein product [Merluccius merluccius]